MICPRIAGVSFTTTSWRIRLRPTQRAVSFWLAVQLIKLLLNVTLNCFAMVYLSYFAGC